MSTTVRPAPTASLAPGDLLAPSSDTIYTDAPVGFIGGTISTPEIVFIGGGAVRQQQQQVIRQPQPKQPKPITIVTSQAHDQPVGAIVLGGSISETYTPPTAPKISATPTIRDIILAARQPRTSEWARNTTHAYMEIARAQHHRPGDQTYVVTTAHDIVRAYREAHAPHAIPTHEALLNAHRKPRPRA